MAEQARDPHTFPLQPRKLTWAALLGHWVDFARSTAALPSGDADAARVKQTVADIIGLQAVWFALHHLDELDADQRALGLDRAELLIVRHEAAIRDAWGNEPVPEALRELIHDAQSQLAVARAG